MPTNKLTALAVRKINKPGRYGDGGNLHLLVRTSGARSWVLRYRKPGSTGNRDMGLGSVESVSLAEAREAAARARASLREGKDPIALRQVGRQQTRHGHTFREIATRYIEEHRPGWKSAVHAAQWSSTLETYAMPTIGHLQAKDVTPDHVVSILKPIWLEKQETASRLRGRIESILSYATAQGWRSGDNPARWRDHLKHLLPAKSGAGAVKHHAALDWRKAPAFIAKVAERPGAGAQALRFTVFCASRTAEVTGAVWGEIDLDKRTWTIPAVRMKAKCEHVVPLSTAACRLLDAVRLPGQHLTDFVFPGDAPGSKLSDASMSAVLERMKHTDITVHGFRSTFRDWVADATDHPREVAEAALAHGIRDKTEAAYFRTKLFDKRAKLMQDWADYLAIS